MSTLLRQPRLNVNTTTQYCQQLDALTAQLATDFDAARQIARRFLGVHSLAERQALFGFWVPHLSQAPLSGQVSQFSLELYLPTGGEPLDTLTKGQPRQASYQRINLPMQAAGDYLLAVVDDIPLGSRTQDGALYWLVLQPQIGERFVMRDPLAQSLPLGVYAPAEAYDMRRLLADRADLDYFQTFYRQQNPDGSLRARDIGITLEIHTETATEEGTIAALTQVYKDLADKVRANLTAGRDPYADFSPAERNFVGFDTVELTPEVPPVEREGETHPTGEFFQILAAEPAGEGVEQVTVQLKKPDISNWGYDTPILGTAAVNPSILATGRPHEFLDFIEVLHTFPHRPIQLSFDAVLGHADFQGARLLATPEQDPVHPGMLKYVHSAYFRGASMYGRDLNYADPTVRAILLELYRRKMNFGFDCVRVDGGQDFVKSFDPETGFRVQDDEFIREMVTQRQEIPVGSDQVLIRHLDMNVEDGRPWPNDMNWLYNATYIEHLLLHPLPYGDRVKQWGSLIFAHNVHGKYKWFSTKWDRFKDTFKDGQDWITGHSNHDNARYFYRLVSEKPGSQYQTGQSFDDYYNDDLGATYPEATHRALDNPALTALVLGFLPGSPMFFLNALHHTPWLFFRNTDDQYGVKVVADEGSRFLTWYVDETLYNRADAFPRLKAMGFERLTQLIREPRDTQSRKGLMNLLFDLHEAIKTAPTLVYYLFDRPQDWGGYATLEDLVRHATALETPDSPEGTRYRAHLDARIEDDPLEAKARVAFATRFIQKTRAQLAAGEHNDPIRRKLDWLASLIDAGQTTLLALLLEDAALAQSYDLTLWGQNPNLVGTVPAGMLETPEGGSRPEIPPERLKAFAAAFMADARDLCVVPRYNDTVEADHSAFTLTLRQYRRDNPWLAKNPVNDVARDFFNRKILANGAKNTGAFFSDKGDIVNANTIYYGWRTHPTEDRQVFFLANMEGRPLDRLALADFLPGSGQWRLVLASPGLGELPEVVDERLVLRHVTNGQALLLERDVPTTV